jgi:hypothetical protein
VRHSHWHQRCACQRGSSRWLTCRCQGHDHHRCRCCCRQPLRQTHSAPLEALNRRQIHAPFRQTHEGSGCLGTDKMLWRRKRDASESCGDAWLSDELMSFFCNVRYDTEVIILSFHGQHCNQRARGGGGGAAQLNATTTCHKRTRAFDRRFQSNWRLVQTLNYTMGSEGCSVRGRVTKLRL